MSVLSDHQTRIRDLERSKTEEEVAGEVPKEGKTESRDIVPAERKTAED